ncbi:MAG: type II toxin-antitoxin system PemK/MazF family toxin [Syntrophales bacterium]|jgi:mRNA interferase MazF|nr:type II toxin-antitoxin system PemK/MazF family toxin [Syntrophales bacterium]
MTAIERGMVVDIDLDPVQGSETGKLRPCIVVTNDIYNARVPVIQVVPITSWSDRKANIITNVTIEPSAVNGLTKRSVADCLQTRPIDYRARSLRVRGTLESEYLDAVDRALKMVFSLQ